MQLPSKSTAMKITLERELIEVATRLEAISATFARKVTP